MSSPPLSSKLRIVFAGTPDFAATSLLALLMFDHQVVGVYTQPDRPSGRGRKVTQSPVKVLAEQYNIPVFQPLSLQDSCAQATLLALNADLIVVVAYGLLLPPRVLTAARLGCINVHASLLPRWRGAAPIQHAVLAGDEVTGVTIMQMAAGLDMGDMLSSLSCPINENDTGSTLHDKLAEQGAQCLLEALQELPALQQKAIAQDHKKTSYAHKLDKAQARVDWSQSAKSIERLVRAFNSWPVAYSELGGARVRIWQAKVCEKEHHHPSGTILRSRRSGIAVACGEGCLVITAVQLPGGKVLPVSDVLNAKKTFFMSGNKFT